MVELILYKTEIKIDTTKLQALIPSLSQIAEFSKGLLELIIDAYTNISK